MEYGLLGEKLPHSFSKIIHEKLGKYNYDLKELSLEEFNLFMQQKDFKGINITIPYKQEAIKHLDFIDESAKAIGVVNTVINKDNKLYGYNTDFLGLKELINKNNIDISGKKVAILGGGATSKTAYAVCAHLKAGKILRVSRTKSENCITYSELVSTYNDIDVIFNTTPLGMYPNIFSSAVSVDDFKNLSAVVDVVYNPINTKLVIDAKNKGIKAVGGLYMVVAQAVFAASIFLNSKDIISKLDEIYNSLLKEKTNIVLVGMPSSGKTTIGYELSKKLNREFIDIDDLITKKYGKITDIFNDNGEQYFRNLETETIKEISNKNGVVISTGGGAVLRQENIDALKFNGKIFFLDRPLELLMPTDDRPLFNDASKIESLYKERIGIYKSVAEVTIDVNNDCSYAINQILKLI